MMGKLQTTNSGQVVRDQRPQQTLVGLLGSLKPEFERALPKHLNPDRLARLALTALRTTRNLSDCSPGSFAAAIMSCAALGLEPNTPLGQAYLIPRRNKGQQECTLQVGYQGMLDLARRSGMVASIQATPVFEGDFFQYEMGLEPKLVHRPIGEDDPAKLTHCYAVCKLKDKDADPIFVVLTRKQIEARRARGGYKGSGGVSPWNTDFVPMAQKSAIRALFTWMPRSAEMAMSISVETAQETGMSVVNELPEHAAEALLNAGVTDEPETVDAEFEPEPDREPGQEG